MARHKKTDREIRAERAARAKQRARGAGGKFVASKPREVESRPAHAPLPGRDSRGRFISREVEAFAARDVDEPPARPIASVRAVLDCVARKLGGEIEQIDSDYKDEQAYYALVFHEEQSLTDISWAMRTCELFMPSEGRILVSMQMQITGIDGEEFYDWRAMGFALTPDVSWAHAESELPNLRVRYHATMITALTIMDWGEDYDWSPA